MPHVLVAVCFRIPWRADRQIGRPVAVEVAGLDRAAEVFAILRAADLGVRVEFPSKIGGDDGTQVDVHAAGMGGTVMARGEHR